jgi:signal transduction histidine kinase
VIVAARLTLLVCENLRREFERVLDSDHFQDVSLSTFSADCHRGTIGEEANLPGVLRGLLGDADVDAVRVFGGSCLKEYRDLPEEAARFRYVATDTCQALIAGSDLIDSFVAQGAYLLTPGWLARWEGYLRDWGFNRETAREYFRDALKKIVLLDTGVDRDCMSILEEFSSFIDVPYEAVKVGLDLLRLRVTNAVAEWRLEMEREASITEIGMVTKKAADLEMSFELIRRLVDLDSEQKVIEEIVELFTMLSAPAKLVYAALDRGKQPIVQPQVSYAKGQQSVSRALPAHLSYAWIDEGSGFQIGIDHLGKRLGILEIGEFAHEEYKDYYLGIALTLSAVCGLAIANARHVEALQAANAELEAYDQVVSHDLQTPLAAIIPASQTLELLIKDMPDECRTDVIERLSALIKSGAEKAIAMIREMLTLAAAGQAPHEIELVNISEVVEGILSDYSGQIERGEVAFDVDEYLGSIYANPTQINQIFGNLIRNSLDHAKRKGLIVTIEHREERRTGEHAYRVRDNGGGIPDRAIDHVFEPLYRADGHGTGIGLTIVQKLVTGSMGARSGPSMPAEPVSSSLSATCRNEDSRCRKIQQVGPHGGYPLQDELALLVNSQARCTGAVRSSLTSGPGIIAERPMYFNYLGWDRCMMWLGTVLSVRAMAVPKLCLTDRSLRQLGASQSKYV